MIHVHNEVKIYEIDDKEIPIGNSKKLHVESHWNSEKMVILMFVDFRITVTASDLQQAISNATNSNRYG